MLFVTKPVWNPMQKRLNHIMNTNAPCLRGDGENIWAISCLPESRQGKRILEKWSKNNKKLQTGRTSWKPPKPEPTTLFLLGNWSSGIVQAKWQSRKCAVDSQSLECLTNELSLFFFRGKKRKQSHLPPLSRISISSHCNWNRSSS